MTAPQIRSDVTMGAWYGLKPRFAAGDLDGVPFEIYLAALQAEGVDVHRPGSAPLHLSPIFAGVSAPSMPFTHLGQSCRRR